MDAKACGFVDKKSFIRNVFIVLHRQPTPVQRRWSDYVTALTRGDLARDHRSPEDYMFRLLRRTRLPREFASSRAMASKLHICLVRD